jgi:hypothetical protein
VTRKEDGKGEGGKLESDIDRGREGNREKWKVTWKEDGESGRKKLECCAENCCRRLEMEIGGGVGRGWTSKKLGRRH